MNRVVAVVSILAGLMTAFPVLARMAGATADGTWDCRDMNDVPIGALVVADTSYAFFKLDGRVGAYGKLHQIGEAEFHLPHFVILGGHLKDEIGAVGLALTGPRENEHDLSGELFLAIIITETNVPYCRRRTVPAA